MATLGILHGRLDRGFGRGIAVEMVGLRVGGSTWDDSGSGDYNFVSHNCQSFTQTLLVECGLASPWHPQNPFCSCATGPSGGSPSVPGPRQTFPKPPGIYEGGYPNPRPGGGVKWD